MSNEYEKLLQELLAYEEEVIPKSRIEAYLLALCEKMGGGGGGGSGLPMVTLTTAPTADGAPLTDAENAELNAAVASGTPIIVRSTSTELGVPMTVNAVCNYLFAEVDGMTMRLLTGMTIAMGDGYMIALMSQDGETWEVSGGFVSA